MPKSLDRVGDKILFNEMKKLKKMLAVALVFGSFMSIATQSKAMDEDFKEQYCALTYMCGATFTLCAESEADWPDAYLKAEEALCG